METLSDVQKTLLDALVPEHGDIPGAGSLGLLPLVMADADDEPKSRALQVISAALPDDFVDLSSLQRESLLLQIETAYPNEFSVVVNMVFTAYYCDQRVLDGIARHTGYNPQPPQPTGYQLPAFDEQLLQPVRESPPRWRTVD